MLIDFRERVREGKREGEKHLSAWLPLVLQQGTRD